MKLKSNNRNKQSVICSYHACILSNLLKANSAVRSAANNYAGYHFYVFQLPDFKERRTKTNPDDN